MTVVAVTQPPPTGVARGLDVTAKAGLVLLLASVLADPDASHLRDKAAGLRAVCYPLLAFALPALWLAFRRDRAPFPWVADLMVTLTCFSDILGNRMDLYDSVVWFDDWMHLANTGLLSAVVIMLTLPRTASLSAHVERALAFGLSAALAWEIAEYFAFLSRSSELPNAYADTLGDLGTRRVRRLGGSAGRPRGAPKIPALTPPEIGCEVPEHALDEVGVVVDPELVRDGEQQGVRGRDSLVLGEVLDQLVGLAGVRLAEPGDSAVEVADLVLAAGLAPEVGAVQVARRSGRCCG